MSNSVYLITTRLTDSPILKNSSTSIDLFKDDTFWDFFINDQGPIAGILTMVKEWRKAHPEDDRYNALEDSLSSIKEKKTYDGDREELKESIVACALDTDRGIAKNKKERARRKTRIKITIKLFGTIQKLDGTQVYITHNWYNKAPLNFAKGSKHLFLELLIGIVQDHSKCSEVKLFAHDKDIFDRSVKDSVIAKKNFDGNYINAEQHPRLHAIIEKNNAYAFQHDKYSMFQKHVLKQKSVAGLGCRLDKILTISHDFVSINIVNLETDTAKSSKDIIHIHLNFSTGYEYQFPQIFKQLIDFNHHAWKQHLDLIPDQLKERAESYGVEKFTSLPILVSSDRSLTTSTKEEAALIDLEPRARYMDSSIWLRFIQLGKEESTNQETTIKEKAQKLFPDDFSVYQTANAREIREFNARLCINSRLQDLVSGHGKHITPFPFCSETDNYKAAVEQWSILGNKINLNELKIRVLLIDDRSVVNKESNAIGKIDVLKGVLGEEFTVLDEIQAHSPAVTEQQEKKESTKPTIYIDYASTIEEAKAKTALKKYDILLLDYLFENKDGVEFGIKLLKDITECKEKQEVWFKQRGPLKMFWIYFISTFSTAIREDMRLSNMHYSEKYWHIARGACPLNTPGLFKANFYYLLNRQLEELIDIGESAEDLKGTKWIVTILDYLHALFKKRCVKETAAYSFNAFLRLRSHYNNLHEDYFFHDEKDNRNKANGSPLVQSLFPDIEYYGNAFWSHLQHLIYLIAFGNAGQWEIMWSEYQCIKHALKRAEEQAKQQSEHQNQDNKKEEESICHKIEDHIVTLKYNNHI